MSGAGRGEMQYDMGRKNVEKVPYRVQYGTYCIVVLPGRSNSSP
jgi:hypothetical protein